ncbi:non-ribosomal peptide synthetase [Pedobacter steynii]|uniref:Carrier domain-containing protein n=1 Tax=Pedobacter steynii TaxID=430522 RepID=A0A1D7QJG3_9SPHI|nr:non-ribosomal peptide synthetase [Pedobacter steynii]AOM78759.1 hypothetical protein BFS30_17200 [Pedobacter steynii]
MRDLIYKLRQNNIAIDVIDSELQLSIPNGLFLDEIIEEVRANKQELISFIEQAKNNKKVKAIHPVGKKPYYALSSAQRRLYFLYEFDRDSLAYNMPRAVWLDGELDQDRLSGAFRALIHRHEVLRTRIVMIGDEPFQVIGDGSDFSITDYQCLEEEVGAVMSRFIRPFDLGRGPLIRVGLVHVANGATLMMVDMHHIITDGVSHGILIRDFMALYDGQELSAPGLQYKDYSEWQQSAAEQERMAEQKSFWLSAYQDLPEVLDLPCDYERPDHRNHRGESHGFELDEQITGGLRRLAEEQDSTLYVVLLSVYTILLGRLGNREDVVVGTPIAGRRHADLDEMIGMFVNTLALRNYPLGSLSFRDFLKEVSSRTLSCFDHQDFQYEDLVDELKLPRDLGRNPLIEVMFSYENFEIEQLEIPGLVMSAYQQEGEKSSKFDLSLSASEQSGRLYLALSYSIELFSALTIRRFGTYFKQIIDQVLSAPDIRLSELDLLSSPERLRLLDLGRGAVPAYRTDQTVVALFSEQVLKHPDARAIFFEDQELSYQELDHLSNQLSHYLKATEGLQKGELAGVKLERSSWLIIAQLAILKTGAAYVSIDPNYPDTRIDFITNDSQCRFIIDGVFIAGFEALCDSYPRSATALMINGNDPAYVIYTSGSTGLPKGVLITHQSLSNLCLWHQHYYGVCQDSRGTLYSSVGFDASVWEIYPYLVSGGSLYPILRDEMRYDVHALQKFFGQHQITHSYLPSIICQDLVRNDIDLDGALILTGGDVLRINEGTSLKIYNNYGPTENTVVTTVADLTGYKGGVISIGRPISGTCVYILDQYQGLSPEGASGELCISGLGLAAGYVNNEALTAEKFVSNPFEKDGLMYRTGDLVRWGADGNIEFLGRIDDQVKIRGYRIEPGEIEVVISGLEEINQALVVVKEERGDQHLVAYYTTSTMVSVADLKQRLQGLLPEYMLPSYYVHLSEFPLTVSGKIDRRGLPELSLDVSDDYLAASTELERTLTGIWSEVLKIDQDKISVNKSFFDLGGHSLKAVQLISQINKKIKKEVGLVDLFRSSTISALAEVITVKEYTDVISDENLVLLKGGEKAIENLFFIHEVSGSVRGYVELAGLMGQYNCWGLRSELLNSLAPQSVDIKEMASRYVRKLKLVQKTGPYKIAGWSLGGVIALEMIQQLELNGEKNNKVIMIDSPLPVFPNNIFAPKTDDFINPVFTLNEEKALIGGFEEKLISSLTNVQTVKECWELAAEHFEKEGSHEYIINKLPKDMLNLVLAPGTSNKLSDTIKSINTIRSLRHALQRFYYGANEKSDAQLIYMKAETSEVDLRQLQDAFLEKIVVVELGGGHFDLLKAPSVVNVAEYLKKYLDNSL